MEVKHHRMRTRGRGTKELIGEFAAGPREDAVDDLTDVGSGRHHRGAGVQNARASVGLKLSNGGRSIDAMASSIMVTSSCMRRTTPSLHCSTPGPLKRNPQKARLDDLVADRAVAVHAGDVRE